MSASRGWCLRPGSLRGPSPSPRAHPATTFGGRGCRLPSAAAGRPPPSGERRQGPSSDPECSPLGQGHGESSRLALQRPSSKRTPARGPADPRRGPAWCQGDARACTRPRARPPRHSHSHSHPAVLFVPGQAHFNKWLESLERHLTGAAKSWRRVEVRTHEVRGPDSESSLTYPPRTPGARHLRPQTPPTPTHTHTCWGIRSPALLPTPEAHFRREAMPVFPACQGWSPAPLSSPPSRVPPGH